MFTRILFPTDFSSHAQKTLECFLGLKEVGVEEIILITVVDDRGVEYPVAQDMTAEVEKYLEEIRSKVEQEGYNVRAVVRKGSPYLEILKAAEEEEVTLIAFGSHGKSPLEEVLLGSVSERVVREAKVPVLIVRYRLLEGEEGVTLERFSENTFRKILYPTDFSTCSKNTLRYIESLKTAGGEEVVVAHTIDERHITRESLEDVRIARRHSLERIKEELETWKYNVKVSLSTGVPLARILDIAEEEDVSIIVLGPHGKGLVKEMLLGSVSENVVRMAKRPVLVIHERDVGGL